MLSFVWISTTAYNVEGVRINFPVIDLSISEFNVKTMIRECVLIHIYIYIGVLIFEPLYFHSKQMHTKY